MAENGKGAARIRIDGVEHTVDPSRNLLDVCLSLGLNLPYFCWHPALGSVGACRQCAVTQYKDENDTKGKLVMACMTPAADGTRISLKNEEASEFRQSVIEWLMTNHPHDCPICDEGGECHLQDMTVMTGHDYRSYRFRKRTFRNQDLGPLVNHEMNRCIQCYRCVRFYRDFAGGTDLHAFATRNHTWFGRHEDGVLESEFSGNLVEVCPTGVFTDKALKSRYTRKWDLQTAPSVCQACGLGCNTTPGERYGQLRRIRARYNGHVNGWFLCDRGRYGAFWVNGEQRLRRPLLPAGPEREAAPLEAEDAVKRVAAMVSDPARTVGIGSPRASLESNFALRTLVGPERFFAGTSAADHRLTDATLRMLRRGPCRTPSLREVERCDAVLVLGEDATNTAPMLALAIRQASTVVPRREAQHIGVPAWNDAAFREAVQERKGPVFVATAAPTKLDDAARKTFRGSPEEIARLGEAVAHALDPANARPDGLPAEMRALAEEIAAALSAADRPLVVSGFGAGSFAVLLAAERAARAAAKPRGGTPAELFLTVPEANSLGLAMLGGGSVEEAIDAVEHGRADTVLVLENDLHRRTSPERVKTLLAKAKHVVVLDHSAHGTAAEAEVVLPVATFAESSGTVVSNEGRAQRFVQVFAPDPPVPVAWRWLRDVARAAGRGDAMAWERLDDVTAAVAAAEPSLAAVATVGAPSDLRPGGARPPRAPHRQTGRTAAVADRMLHEPKPPEDPDSPFSFSMEGWPGSEPPSLTSEFWAAGWNSIQSLNRFQEEIGGPLRGGDPGARLIEPGGDEAPERAAAAAVPAGSGAPAPAATAVPGAHGGDLRVVPLHHIHGSDELAAMSPPATRLAPEPSVALSPEDAARLGLAAGDAARITFVEDGAAGGGGGAAGPGELRLPVRILEGLAPRVAGLPAGLPGLPLPALPDRCRVEKP